MARVGDRRMKDDLSKRSNWQHDNTPKAQAPEKMVYLTFKEYFKGHPYCIHKQPKDFRELYGRRHGIVPDHKIYNKNTGKGIFVETKRQNHQGQGNAHERVYKYFLPSIVEAGRLKGKIASEHFPYWLIFTEGLALNDKFKREIQFSLKGYEDSYFLWSDLQDQDSLIKFFEDHIQQRLE